MKPVSGISLRAKFPPLGGRGWLVESPLVRELNPRLDHPDVFGVEFEIEGVTSSRMVERLGDVGDGHTPQFSSWLVRVTEDQSLANGCELVTCPMTVDEMRCLLPALFQGVGRYNVTDRCSTHVHMNILDLTWEEIRSVLILYRLLEDVMYQWVGEERRNCVFSVPLSSVSRGATYHDWFRKPQLLESRYLGLNVREILGMGVDGLRVFGEAVGGQGRHPTGTMEFRHLHGIAPKQLDKLFRWVEILLDLKKGGRLLVMHPEFQTQILDLNASSRYAEVVSMLCPVAARELFDGIPKHELASLLEGAVTRIKTSELEADYMSIPATHIPNSPYGMYYFGKVPKVKREDV